MHPWNNLQTREHTVLFRVTPLHHLLPGGKHLVQLHKRTIVHFHIWMEPSSFSLYPNLILNHYYPTAFGWKSPASVCCRAGSIPADSTFVCPVEDKRSYLTRLRGSMVLSVGQSFVSGRVSFFSVCPSPHWWNRAGTMQPSAVCALREAEQMSRFLRDGLARRLSKRRDSWQKHWLASGENVAILPKP